MENQVLKVTPDVTYQLEVSSAQLWPIDPQLAAFDPNICSTDELLDIPEANLSYPVDGEHLRYTDSTNGTPQQWWDLTQPMQTDQALPSSLDPLWHNVTVLVVTLADGLHIDCAFWYHQDPWQVAEQFCTDNNFEESFIQDLATHLESLRDESLCAQDGKASRCEQHTTRQAKRQRTARKPKVPSKNAVDQSKLPEITIPLSELAKQMDTPVEDIAMWVRRSASERHSEVAPGQKVPRPMNSFMLYRKAYAAVTKQWSANTKNNQIVSVVTGRSWRLESKELRAYFTVLAKAESDAHARVWPDYKYCPAQREAKRKRMEEQEEEIHNTLDEFNAGWTGTYHHTRL